KAAFTDEYDDRGWLDNIQDRIPGVAIIIPRIKIDILDIDTDANDLGLSNIDYNTASRLKDKYNIDIPQDKSLEEYLTTDEGCTRFTAAAIKEAEEELAGYSTGLPPEKKEIMGSLSKEEKDALSVAVYKRGPEESPAVLELAHFSSTIFLVCTKSSVCRRYR
ncbi:MAG: hypothetical protein JXQ83_06825, partial [Candidatus Glassbacteria bacterium]|nr:hypothetical protein [Candidatus Glassbacteria bacterium]